MNQILTKYIGVRLVALMLCAALHLAPKASAQPSISQDFIASVRIPPVVSIGDTIRAAIVLRALTPTARQLRITSVDFVLRFNPSVVYLLDTNLSRLAYYAGNGMEVSVRQSVQRSLQALEDTIFSIPLLITWGDTEFSELKIGGERTDPGYSFQVNDITGFRNVPVENRFFRIRDAAWGDSLLTLNQLGSPLRMTIGPNPAMNVLNIQLNIGNLQPQPFALPTLALYFLQGPFAGSEALDFTPLLMPLFRTRTMETLRANLRLPNGMPLPRGLYLCRFSYATYAVSRLVFVQ
ncbi:MAG: hypothetical protein EAZ92_13065 [Candidatus Kapaibacterium sp.]|nr:MAG: hypothetical protein EAZ92_13065 [Candidatus Kapabacteria bacterium]